MDVSQRIVVHLVMLHVHHIRSSRRKQPDLPVLIVRELLLFEQDLPEDLLCFLVQNHFGRAVDIVCEIVDDSLVLLVNRHDLIFLS